jgi:hypothetical protein
VLNDFREQFDIKNKVYAEHKRGSATFQIKRYWTWVACGETVFPSTWQRTRQSISESTLATMP